MLKNVMIICMVFSLVLIGGIAFASAEQPPAPQEGQTETLEPETEPATPSDPAQLDMSTQESETTSAEEEEVEKEGAEEEKDVEGGEGH